MRPSAAGLCLASLALVVGCGGGHSGGPSVSPCFRVLPQAHTAVGGQGTFVDVARIQGRRIDVFPGTQPPTTAAPTSTAPGPRSSADARRDVCLIAYRGTFNPDLIPNLGGQSRHGTYAVVVVGVRSQRVRAVFLTDQLPRPLRHH